MKPKHKTKMSAGADLTASESVEIEAGCTVLVGTGYKLEEKHRVRGYINGLVYMLFIRSSLAFKRGLSLANGVGVIDADYKDEIKVMLTNHTSEPVSIIKGERIAQIVPMAYYKGFFDVEDTERAGGIGSTGE